MTQALGIFGGTFDPIHIGHLAAAEDAAFQLQLDRVLFVPNQIPPHKRDRKISSATDRFAMVALAIAGNPLFELSTIELQRDGPSYTLDTLRELQAGNPDSRLVFLSGYDVLPTLHTWHEPQKILEEFEVVLLERPGEAGAWETAERHFPRIRTQVKVVPIPLLEISSHDIRERVRAGRPFRYYLPEAVAAYVQSRRMYET